MRLRSDENENTLRPGMSSGYLSRTFSYGCWSWLLMIRSAHSVSLPQYVNPLPPGGGGLRKVLKRVLTTEAVASCSLIAPATAAACSKTLPPAQMRTTVIFDVVNVPVLSEQMVVAPPMVSHADKCRTRFWSLSIFLTENASAIVTASGRPSGTATTKIVTPEMRKESSSDQCTWWSHASLQQRPVWKDQAMRMQRTMTVKMAKAAPAFVISFVMSSSFVWRTERACSASASSILVFMVPWYVAVPTAMTSMRPSPSCTKVPPKMVGVWPTLSPSNLYSPFFLSTGSPVSIFSLMARSLRPTT
mmetsp:Transcript_8763/g.20683  ORF Transcript_8763/g.20683 Transcript_8763/m.20683 type:complete len:303 (-) Transcript_8763:996-1904(-)